MGALQTHGEEFRNVPTSEGTAGFSAFQTYSERERARVKQATLHPEEHAETSKGE
jgi:hypothetical protein